MNTILNTMNEKDSASKRCACWFWCCCCSIL